MRITIVGNRNGQAVIHWPGVILASLLVTAIFSVGVVLMSLALRWFSPMSFVMLPVILGRVIGIGIKRGLETPPQELPSIG